MKRNSITMLVAAIAAFAAGTGVASAQYYYTTHDEALGVPERAIIISGDPNTPGNREHIAVLYSREDLAFDDPSAPRFLFLDSQGKVALGIGGYLKGIAMYDMDGAIDGTGFDTYQIPVPFNPAQRDRFGADVSHSTIFLKMVARNTPLGRMTVYMQTNFTGGGGTGYGLKLKQAYLSVGHVTVGLARSTFSDGPSQAPTVDTQGPSGQITAKNMLVQYISPKWKGFSFAVSAEVPKASYTTDAKTEAIAQRVPDFPAYIQYAWGSGSHVRLSGLLRELSYRDLATGTNRFATGWGAQFSTVAKIYGGLGIFGHVSYGHGISHYVNDLDGEGFDLVASPDGSGRMEAPGVFTFTGGVKYDFSKDFFVSASYSQARLHDVSHLASDTYSYGQYLAVNGFYNISPDLRVGVEYLHGNRTDLSGTTGRANRVDCMLQYSF